MKPPISGIRLERLKAKRVVREAHLRGDRTLGERFKAAMWGPVQTVASRIRDFIASTEPRTAPAVAPVPTVSGSDPEAVESRVAGLFKFDARAIGRTETIKRVEQIQSFVDRVQAIDPSGKVLERVSDGTPDERTAAAKVIAGILDGLSSPTSPAPVVPSKPAPSAPRGLSAVEDSIRREIGAARSTSSTTPFRPATVPSKPATTPPVKVAPAQGESLSSRLSGTARAEAAIRESLGQKPLAAHVALADKLSPIQK